MGAVGGVCRGCGGRRDGAPKGERCPECGAARSAHHPEIHTLCVAHLDCDAFYATIEKRDDPSLETRPVIVGGGARGVVATACYVARAFGVRSAMPMFKARAACPDAVVIKPNMAKYVAESRRLRVILESATPLVEMISIDEAFLDLTGTERLHAASPGQTAARLQAQIARELGITVSVGLSYNRFLAKIASELDKPNGFAVLGRGEALDFLANKPVTIIPGVGPAFAKTLARGGVRVIADLRARTERQLADAFGEQGLRLARLARGEDARPVTVDRARKSVSAEITFSSDLSDWDELEAGLWRVCERTATRAKAAGVMGRAVTLKAKTDRFEILTRRRTLSEPTHYAHTFFDVAQPLLSSLRASAPFRLLGLGVADLSPAEEAGLGGLLDAGSRRRDAGERAVDALRAKFGPEAVVKGRAFRPAPETGPPTWPEADD